MSVPITKKDVTEVKLTDKDGTNFKTLDLENGDLQFTLPKPHEHAMDRGRAGVILDADFAPIKFSLSGHVVAVSGTDEVADVVTCTAAGWDFDKVDTASGDYTGKTADLQDVSSDVGVWQMKVTITHPNTGATEVLYFIDCVATYDFSEGIPSKWSLSSQSYQKASTFMANIG